jgi:hypothetical protein
MVHAILFVGVITALVLAQLVVVFTVCLLWFSFTKDRHS